MFWMFRFPFWRLNASATRSKNGQLGLARPQQCFRALDDKLGRWVSLFALQRAAKSHGVFLRSPSALCRPNETHDQRSHIFFSRSVSKLLHGLGVFQSCRKWWAIGSVANLVNKKCWTSLAPGLPLTFDAASHRLISTSGKVFGWRPGVTAERQHRQIESDLEFDRILAQFWHDGVCLTKVHILSRYSDLCVCKRVRQKHKMSRHPMGCKSIKGRLCMKITDCCLLGWRFPDIKPYCQPLKDQMLAEETFVAAAAQLWGFGRVAARASWDFNFAVLMGFDSKMTARGCGFWGNVLCQRCEWHGAFG